MKKAFINGRIRTIDEGNSCYEAMLVADGKVEMLGTIEEIREAGPDEVIDLAGGDVLPGFIDTHLHMMDHAIYERKTADLYDTKNVEDLIETMKRYIEEQDIPEGEWVCGFGWDQDLYPGGEFPNCRQIDLISVRHPIMLTRRCGTICVANSTAMRIAGVDRNTPDPQGGEIEKFPDGEPTGIMLESAMSLIGNCVPKIKDKAVLKELLAFSCGELLKNGITVAHTEDFPSVGDKKALMEAYLELQEEGRLPVNLVLQLRIHNPSQIDDYIGMGIRSWQEFGRIKVGPIKFLGDGSLGAWTASLKAPYSDKPETSGLLIYELPELCRMAEKAVSHDFDLTIHAIGDRAVDTFLEACIRCGDMIRQKGFRPSVIHSQIMDEEIFQKYHMTDATAIVQPMYVHSDWKIADDRVGDRMKTSYCFKKMRDLGVRCAAGSDLPIEDANPFSGIQVNVTRKDLAGEPEGGWYPEEMLSVLEAVKFHTIYGAYVSGDEKKYGSLEPGKQANFVVLSDDVFTVEPSKIKNIQILATYIDGEEVYHK